MVVKRLRKEDRRVQLLEVRAELSASKARRH